MKQPHAVTTEEIRNRTFNRLQAKLAGLRMRVHQALQMWGPCTTRVLAERMRADLLNVRPRVTELCEAGLATLEGDERGSEGVYRAVRLQEALEAAVEREIQAHRVEQMQLL